MENDKQVPADLASNRSRLGSTALILSLMPLLMAGLYVLAFYLFISLSSSNSSFLNSLPYMFWLALSFLPGCFSGIGVIFTLIALILGVMSLFRREPQKWPAILAIVLSLPGGVIMALMTFLVMVISRT